MSDDDRTYDPSDQRLESFRKEGRFARSRDLGGVLATAAVLATLSGTRDSLSASARRLFSFTLGDLGALERVGPSAILARSGTELAVLCGAAVLVAMFSGVFAGGLQSKFKLYQEMLTPKMDRLNPAQGLQRLFGLKRAASETAVALFRVAIVGVLAWNAMQKELPSLVGLSRVPLDAAIPSMLASLARIAGHAVAALFFVSAVDYAQSWYSNNKQLKMTRKEREDETKSTEGDLKAKHKMKAKARALSRKRAMNAVKNADVIVTNPTHYAVALRYGPKDPAPVVLAKGEDDVALRIRAEARKHGIPILENRKLARALYAEVAVGRPVPAAHFAAVARVLAFVFKLKGGRRQQNVKMARR